MGLLDRRTVFILVMLMSTTSTVTSIRIGCYLRKMDKSDSAQFYPSIFNMDIFNWWRQSRWMKEHMNQFKTYTSVNNYNHNKTCAEFICTETETLNSTGRIKETCCEYNSTMYHHGYPMYREDCFAYVCSNGTWIETIHTDPRCCQNPNTDFEPLKDQIEYHEYSYRDHYYYYYLDGVVEARWSKLNETSYFPDCRERVCTSKDNWVTTGGFAPECCLYNGTWYNEGYLIYEDDCSGDVCSNGTWIEANHTDPNCCLHDGTWYNEGYPIYEDDCSGDVCSNGTWIEANHTDPNCCLYNGTLYNEGYPIYEDDCSGDVCSNGTWVEANHTDPNCCLHNGTWYELDAHVYMEDCFDYVCWNRNWNLTNLMNPHCVKSSESVGKKKNPFIKLIVEMRVGRNGN